MIHVKCCKCHGSIGWVRDAVEINDALCESCYIDYRPLPSNKEWEISTVYDCSVWVACPECGQLVQIMRGPSLKTCEACGFTKHLPEKYHKYQGEMGAKNA